MKMQYVSLHGTTVGWPGAEHGKLPIKLIPGSDIIVLEGAPGCQGDGSANIICSITETAKLAFFQLKTCHDSWKATHSRLICLGKLAWLVLAPWWWIGDGEHATLGQVALVLPDAGAFKLALFVSPHCLPYVILVPYSARKDSTL